MFLIRKPGGDKKEEGSRRRSPGDGPTGFPNARDSEVRLDQLHSLTTPTLVD